MSSTYSAVDLSSDPQEAADWQDHINAWPAVAAYKRAMATRLGPARPILDVGSGTGGDLVALGPGAVGVEPSTVMCDRARARGAVACRGDAHALPFPDQRFAGVRADRVLQHLAHPVTGLGELVRVLQPGGRLVVADPDQGSLVIEVPGVDQRLTDAVRRRRRERQYRNPTLARRVPGLLHDLGLEDIGVEGFALTITDPDLAFGLAHWVRLGAQAGEGFGADDVARWDAGVERSRQAPGFVYTVTYLVVSARRPR